MVSHGCSDPRKPRKVEDKSRDVGGYIAPTDADIGEQIGVKPAMEFLGFVDQLNTIEDALEVMTKADRDDVFLKVEGFTRFFDHGKLGVAILAPPLPGALGEKHR